MFDKKTTKFIGIGLLLLFLIYISLLKYYKEVTLTNKNRYTTCYVNHLNARGNGGVNVFFEYSVGNKFYTNFYVCSKINYKALKNDYLYTRFLVKYQPSNPKNCKIMLDYRVKEGVKAPPDGWDSIPFRK